MSPALVAEANKHQWGESMVSGSNLAAIGKSASGAGGNKESKDGSSEPDSDEDEEEIVADTPEMAKLKAERAEFKQREVFLTRQMETLPATLIRGKCSVTLLSEVETMQSYIGKEDTFFYALVYDNREKSLVADRGEIRIGSSYQATVTPLMDEKEREEEDGRKCEDLEELRWKPDNGSLSDDDVDRYLVIARSVGTFARALDCSSSVKQPSLHISASSASRDVTLAYAHDLLHQSGYGLSDAVRALVPSSGPMLCRDEMEDWSTSEANLFEEAMDKHGKEFENVRRDYLPWKSMRHIIEYFFMWKTTDRYVQRKRVKALENESKLKQVYVPQYTNKSTRLTGANGEIIIRGKDCDAYPNLAKYSWSKYKQYGKFVPATTTEDCFILDKSSFSSTAARLAQLRPGLIIEPDTPASAGGHHGGGGGHHGGGHGGGGKTSSGKTRAALYLRTTPVTRSARRICAHMVSLRRVTRRPGTAIDMKAIKGHVKNKLPSLSEKQIRLYNTFRERKRPPAEEVLRRLGQNETAEQVNRKAIESTQCTYRFKPSHHHHHRVDMLMLDT